MCVDDDEPKWYETYTIKQMEIEQTVEFVFSLARARKNTIQFIFSSRPLFLCVWHQNTAQSNDTFYY